MSSNKFIKRAITTIALSAISVLGFAGTSSASTTPGINSANYAHRYLLGKTYVLGATGPNAYDCSALVQKAFKSGGNRYLPRTTGTQWSYLRSKGTATTKHVYSYRDVSKGDILFFWKNGSVVHVGLYYTDDNGGKMIDANSSRGYSKVDPAFYNWGFDYITHGWVK